MAEVIKSRKPTFQAIAVEPCLAGHRQTLRGEPLKPGPHKIQGTGAGFVPKNLNLDIIDDVIAVSNEDAFATARLLAKEEGIFAGSPPARMSSPRCEVARRPENNGQADRHDRLLHRRTLPLHGSRPRRAD